MKMEEKMKAAAEEEENAPEEEAQPSERAKQESHEAPESGEAAEKAAEEAAEKEREQLKSKEDLARAQKKDGVQGSFATCLWSHPRRHTAPAAPTAPPLAHRPCSCVPRITSTRPCGRLR